MGECYLEGLMDGRALNLQEGERLLGVSEMGLWWHPYLT